jgi:Putative peptidoglycan binding domain
MLYQASATGTLQSGPQEIFTAALASAEPAVSYRSEEPLTQSSASSRQGQPIEVAVGAAASSREDVQQIQSRLRDLGYLSSAATGIWDLKSRDALRDFKLINRLANSDTLDVETSEKLSSQTAIRAHQSFIGSWSAAPCSSTKTKDLRVTISSRRIRASTGSICEIHSVQSENSGWRVRANCPQRTQHWTANGRFAVRGEKLIWTSERDVINYFRCN